jgi:hypothetical protein
VIGFGIYNSLKSTLDNLDVIDIKSSLKLMTNIVQRFEEISNPRKKKKPTK